MARWITTLLCTAGLLACQEPTLSTGDPSDTGHLYFLRTTEGIGATGEAVLHVATGTNYVIRRAFGGAQVVGSRPAASPDDAYMAWTDVTRGVYPVADLYHLFVRHGSSGTVTELLGAAGEMASYPSWSANRRLFIRWRDFYDGAGGKWRLMSMAADGSARRMELASEPVVGTMPAVSPDGGRIAWILAVTGPPRLEVVDLSSAGRVPRIDTTTYAEIQDPAWAPDGQSIVVTARLSAASEVPRLRVLALDGSLRHELILNDGYLRRPVFAPDGRSVAFCQIPLPSPGGFLSSRVRIWTFATGAVRDVGSDGQGADCYPTWSR